MFGEKRENWKNVKRTGAVKKKKQAGLFQSRRINSLAKQSFHVGKQYSLQSPDR
jgi:hypothetical protein